MKLSDLSSDGVTIEAITPKGLTLCPLFFAFH